MTLTEVHVCWCALEWTYDNEQNFSPWLHSTQYDKIPFEYANILWTFARPLQTENHVDNMDKFLTI